MDPAAQNAVEEIKAADEADAIYSRLNALLGEDEGATVRALVREADRRDGVNVLRVVEQYVDHSYAASQKQFAEAADFYFASSASSRRRVAVPPLVDSFAESLNRSDEVR